MKVPEGTVLRPIPALREDQYSAGSDGHIYCYSTARVNARKPHPFRLMESVGSAGYPFVSVVRNGKRMSGTVHVLVCSAFHGTKPSPVHEVCHFDGNKMNTNPTNLRWGTSAENEADKKRHGTASMGERHGAAKLTAEAVRILRASIPRGLWNPIDSAKVFGVDPTVIRNVVAGKSWKSIE